MPINILVNLTNNNKEPEPVRAGWFGTYTPYSNINLAFRFSFLLTLEIKCAKLVDDKNHYIYCMYSIIYWIARVCQSRAS